MSDQLEQAEDHELARLVQGGDRSAFEALYHRHSPRLHALCRRIVNDHAEAEAVLVTVFWEFWKHRERFDASRGAVSAYLSMLARSRCLDHLRQLRSRQKTLEDAPAPIDDAEEVDPHFQAVASENRKLVVSCLKRLSDTQRKVIECAYFDGLSHTQIADRLDMPLGTVKTHLRQALLRLRNTLRTQFKETFET